MPARAAGLDEPLDDCLRNAAGAYRFRPHRQLAYIVISQALGDKLVKTSVA
jgi:hypothetical protein